MSSDNLAENAITRSNPESRDGVAAGAPAGRYSLIRWVTLAVFIFGCATAFASESGHVPELTFPTDLKSYGDAGLPMLERLGHRITSNPFNLVGTLIFFLAVIHTFLCSKFTALADRLASQYEVKKEQGEVPRTSVSHSARLMGFLGEVEVVWERSKWFSVCGRWC
jgi:hypothetical protein